MTTNLYQQPAKESADNIILAVKMPRELREQWKAHCSQHNLDMSEVIRRFINAELSNKVQHD